MTDIIQLVEAMNDADKQVALSVLDAVSRPLKVYEVEGLLRRAGVSRSQATKMASTLWRLDIIAVMGPERQDSDREDGGKNLFKSLARHDRIGSTIFMRTAPIHPVKDNHQ